IACDDLIREHIPRDDCSRSDQGTSSDSEAAENNRPRPDRCSPFHAGWQEVPVGRGRRHALLVCRSRLLVVHEDNAVTDEDLVLDDNAATDEAVTLDLAALS